MAMSLRSILALMTLAGRGFTLKVDELTLHETEDDLASENAGAGRYVANSAGVVHVA